MQNNVYILQRGLANQLIILVNAFNQLQKTIMSMLILKVVLHLIHLVESH